MPRPSEIQAEETAAPRSPLRRSCRIVAVSSPAPSEAKPVKGRRLSAISNDGKDEEVTVEVKPASRATRGSSVTKENVPNPEPAKTRNRRNSATTESSTTATAEDKKPATRGRRSSVTTEETEIETVKPVRGRRTSVTKDETEIETTKPVRGRRPSVTKDETEIETVKPVRGRRSSVTKDEAEEKKPVKETKSSIKDDKEEESVKKPEDPPQRITRTTRSRRASVEAAEEKEDKKPAPRTPSKLKRRLSVTEIAVVLDPIDEKEQEHDSPTKHGLSVVLTKRKLDQAQVKANLDLSVISETEEAEVTRTRLSKDRKSINANDNGEEKEKNSAPSNPALAVLNKSLEDGRKTPDLIKSELSIVFNKSLEDGRGTPDSPARRSPRLIEKCKSNENHVHMKCDCGQPPAKTKKIDFENKPSPNKENGEKTPAGTVTEKKTTETRISEGSDGSFQLNLSKSKLQSTDDETNLDDSKTSDTSDKENLAQNIETKFTQLSGKNVMEKLIGSGNKEALSQNVTVARVSNVFRPKDIDYSYMEPMEVDMTVDASKLELDSTKLQTEGANESVDETFSLNSSVAPSEIVERDEIVNGDENEASKLKTDTAAKIEDSDKEAVNEQKDVEISGESRDGLVDKTPKKEAVVVQTIVIEENSAAEDTESPAKEKSMAEDKESPAKEKSVAEDKESRVENKSPVKKDKSPVKEDKSPLKEDKSPAKVENSPTKADIAKSPAKEDTSPAKLEKSSEKEEESPAKEETVTIDTPHQKIDTEGEDDVFEEKSMSEDYEFDVPSEEESENIDKIKTVAKSKKSTNKENSITDVQKENEPEKLEEIVTEENIQKEDEINKSTEEKLIQDPIDDNVVSKDDEDDCTDGEVEEKGENQDKRIEENDINEMESSFKDVVNDDEATDANDDENDDVTNSTLKEDEQLKEDASEQALPDKIDAAKEGQEKKIKRLSAAKISEEFAKKRKSRGSVSKDQEGVISPKMATGDSIKSRLSNEKSKTEKRFSLTEWFVKDTANVEPNPTSKKQLNASKSDISVEIIEDTADLNVPLIRSVEKNKEKIKNCDISVEMIENAAGLKVSPNEKEKTDKTKTMSLLDVTNARLDAYIARRLDDFEAEDENSSCSYEDSESGNSFVDDMAEEGEEDTPSEDSNAIIDEGEAINSDSDRSEENDDDDDSFICDEENVDLLSGDEYDLGDEKKPKKSRIINVENRTEDVIKFEKKPTPKRKKSRIIKVDDSSSDEDLNEDLPNEERNRRSSINIIENIDVKEIRDAALSSRINQLVDSFCTTIPDKGGVSMNLSLEFAADAPSEEATTSKRRSKETRRSLTTTETSKRRSGESLKRKSTSNEDLPPKQSRLSLSLIEDSNAAKNKQKRRLSKSMDDTEADAKKLKKKKGKKSKQDVDNKVMSSEDLRKHTYGLMTQLLNDVKNRPRRVIKPSTTKLEDLNSTWSVENGVQVKPSTTIVTEKEMEDFKKKKCHPKDFRQQMLYDSSRVKRIETKQLLKKKGMYY